MRYYDVKNALEQFGAGQLTAAQLATKLKGVKLDKVWDDGHRLLPQLAWEGDVKAIEWLIAQDVDVDLVDTWLAVHGSALMYAATSNRATTKQRLDIIAMLVAAGADVDKPLIRSRSHKPNKGDFVSGTTLDYAAYEALRELKIANAKSYDNSSRRFSKSMHASYLKIIPALVASGATVSKETAAKLKKLDVGAPKAKPLEKDWAKKAQAMLAKGEARDAIYAVTERWMLHEDAVKSADWAKVVGAMIDASRTFEDVAKEVYGEAVSFEDDEGHLCQGWEEYVVLDLVLELLGNEVASKNAKWSALVRRVFEEREKYYAVDYVDVDELFFAKPWVKKHKDAKVLRAIEKKTR